MGDILNQRRAQTADRIKHLQTEVSRAEQLCQGVACVYVTGSFGRREASTHSDLDLFIVGLGTHKDPELSRLNQILVKADLIDASKKLRLPEFSGDGEYLTHHTVAELLESLGKPEDDASNTFTARLLLLLESSPLIGEPEYNRIVEDVIASYWRDYEKNKNDFVPAFLANDILRMWRTFCVNYEARTERVPDEQKAKGKVKNFKLKHSRLLTCYSGLLYLLAVYGRHKTVSPGDAMAMIGLTPTERLDWLLGEKDFSHAHAGIAKLLGQYERFLDATNCDERTIVQQFMDKEKSRAYMEAAYQFGDGVFHVLNSIGAGNRFHRLLVV